jgi:hypothetical protein
MPNNRTRLRFRFRNGSVLALALAAANLSPVHAQTLQSPDRSVSDVRPRIPDEHDRPYFRETQSHRGFEVREPQFTIVADTSRDDARLAAAQVAEAWQQASKLADRWTSRHHNPDFALNSLQVVISSEPMRDLNGPPTTVTVEGIQTLVSIHVNPGQPTLQDQVLRMREGAAFAMLHAVGLDSSNPPWVVAGLASAIGRTGLSEQQIARGQAADAGTALGGQQWRYSRSAPDRLSYPQENLGEAASRMAFLLTGDDAQNAPAVFAKLRQAEQQTEEAAAAGAAFTSFPGNAHPAATNASWDALLAEREQEYAAWKENPKRGQPVFEPPMGLSPDLLAAEREMLVVLKLARRIASDLATTPQAPRGTKIIQFDTDQGLRVTHPSAHKLSLNFSGFAERLLSVEQPAWATLDSDGSLLLSTDTARVEQLLHPIGGRFSFDRQAGKTALVLLTDGGQTIRGWLDENPDDRSRPLARFQTVSQFGRK